MRWNDTNYALVIAAREECVSHVDTLVFLPTFFFDKARDVVSLMLASKKKVISRGSGRSDFNSDILEFLHICRICSQCGGTTRIIRIERILPIDILMESENAITNLCSTMFNKVVLVFYWFFEMLLQYFYQCQNSPSLGVIYHFLPEDHTMLIYGVITACREAEISAFKTRSNLFAYLFN